MIHINVGSILIYCQWYVTLNHSSLVQGEERDSSDEEWAAAYVAMDPLRQLGWRNRRAGVEGPAEQLLRDVFDVADAVQSDAMSDSVGSRLDNDEEGHVHIVLPGDGSVSRPSDDYRRPTSSEEVDQEGEDRITTVSDYPPTHLTCIKVKVENGSCVGLVGPFKQPSCHRLHVCLKRRVGIIKSGCGECTIASESRFVDACDSKCWNRMC
jgi:hypothetical protein